MDMITLAQLNKLKKSGGAGYINPGKVYTYDGKEENLFPITGDGYNITMACIATVTDEQIYNGAGIPNFATLKKVTGVFADGSQLEVMAKDMISGEIDDYEAVFYNYNGIVLPFAVWYRFANDYKLLVFSTSLGYCSRLEFAETIHPIDAKFLPGVCLPVVELSEETKANLVANLGTNQPVTDAEKAFFLAAKEAMTPVIVKADMSDYGMVFAAVLSLGCNGALEPIIVGNAGLYTLGVIFADGDVKIVLTN